MAGYVTSKHAVVGLARSMAHDYGPQGVRVNVLCPGWVRTPMSDEEMRALARARGIGEAEAVALTVRPLPLRRMAAPAEIAACAEFLASDDASFVTGATLVADGGGAIVDVGTLSFARS
jgi:NAD(P)-dependent dehydrogenase (short-subunit alcohol dehydrogenase family)